MLHILLVEELQGQEVWIFVSSTRGWLWRWLERQVRCCF